MRVAFCTIMLTVAFFMTGCEDKESIKSSDIVSSSEEIEESKKSHTLTSLSGESFKVTQNEAGIEITNTDGKVVVLDFFATWCPPCRATAPHLVNLQDKYKDNLVIIGVQMEKKADAKDALQKFKEEFSINYPLVYGEANYDVAEALGGIPSIPYMIIYNPDGEYVNHYIGVVPEEMLEQNIKDAAGLQ
ncbi:MAG: TlpA family protein disulfide reductase [Campylobacterales bacterium]